MRKESAQFSGTNYRNLRRDWSLLGILLRDLRGAHAPRVLFPAPSPETLIDRRSLGRFVMHSARRRMQHARARALPRIRGTRCNFLSTSSVATMSSSRSSAISCAAKIAINRQLFDLAEIPAAACRDQWRAICPSERPAGARCFHLHSRAHASRRSRANC